VGVAAHGHVVAAHVRQNPVLRCALGHAIASLLAREDVGLLFALLHRLGLSRLDEVVQLPLLGVHSLVLAIPG